MVSARSRCVVVAFPKGHDRMVGGQPGLQVSEKKHDIMRSSKTPRRWCLIFCTRSQFCTMLIRPNNPDHLSRVLFFLCWLRDRCPTQAAR